MTAIQHIASRSGLYWRLSQGSESIKRGLDSMTCSKKPGEFWFHLFQPFWFHLFHLLPASCVWKMQISKVFAWLFTDARLHFEKPWIQPRLPSLFVTTMTSRSGFDFTLAHIDKPQWAQVHIRNFGFWIVCFWILYFVFWIWMFNRFGFRVWILDFSADFVRPVLFLCKSFCFSVTGV